MFISVIRRLGRFMACVAVFAMLGGHWAVLQSVAWSRMIVDYSAEFGLRDGISMTFSGEHPCAMCCAIEEARAQTDTPAMVISPATPSVRLLALTHDPLTCVPPRTPVVDRLNRHTAARSLASQRPPVPPPRSFAA
jgi:hypothetical protein